MHFETRKCSTDGVALEIIMLLSPHNFPKKSRHVNKYNDSENFCVEPTVKRLQTELCLRVSLPNMGIVSTLEKCKQRVQKSKEAYM